MIYLVCVQAAVQLSGPYFTPFMLEKLHFSYGMYVILISVAYLAKVLALPAWGRLAQHIGAQQLLWIGGIGIIPDQRWVDRLPAVVVAAGDAGDQRRGLGCLRVGVLPVVFRVDRRGRTHEPADVLQPVLHGRLGERSAGRRH